MAQTNRSDAGTTDLAKSLILLFEDWQEDRKTLQDRWESSRKNFQGIFSEKWKDDEGEDWRSQTHVNLTKQKVTFAYALALDTVLRGGEIPFALRPSPLDRISLNDVPEELAKQTKSAIKDMQDLIKQQQLEAHADRMMMKAMFCMAEYGEAYIKQIRIKVKRKGWRQKNIPGISDMSMIPDDMITWEAFNETVTSIAYDYRPLWNIFRDLENDDLKANRGLFDRDFVSAWWLKQKKGKKGWIDVEIDEAVTKHAGDDQNNTKPTSEDKDSMAPELRDIRHRKSNIRYLEFWGRMATDKVDSFKAHLKTGVETPVSNLYPSLATGEHQDTGDETEIVVGVAGDFIVFFAESDADERPHLRAVWDENLDEVGGTGVADSVKDAQLMLNGGIRAFEDNKKLSGNVILALKKRAFDKLPKSLKPGSQLLLNDMVDSIDEGMKPIVIPDVGNSLLPVVELAERYGDEDSMVPKILQGIGSEGDETALEVSQRIDKGGKYIGAVIRNIDEQFIEPQVMAYYEFNMADPDLEIPKGNYIAKALGFSSFQDQVIRIQKLQQWLALLLSNPAQGSRWKIDDIMKEIGKSLDVSTDQYERSPKEIEELEAAQSAIQQKAMELEIAEKQAEIGKDEAAARKADTDAKVAVAKLELEHEKLKLERAKLIADIERDKMRQGPSIEQLRERNSR